jgi:hypothetical protein
MEAVMRVMAGMEERTIAEKLADPNRPTWEQYKKDNHDKLNLSGMDQQKMEEYRKELDKERDQRLARGSNHQKKSHTSKRKHSDDDDDDDDNDTDDEDPKRKRKSKKHKKSKKKSKKKKYDSSESDTDSSDEERRRKKKSNKKSKKSSKRAEGKDEPEDDRYRLSNFFNATGSDSD